MISIVMLSISKINDGHIIYYNQVEQTARYTTDSFQIPITRPTNTRTTSIFGNNKITKNKLVIKAKIMGF
jgi:hypothetical protein